ncbi:unnamed protein product [Amoebophrya sp. A25]|nr:unnamed protein product [Amoebophrya sp. A25]|eukprot:GSA25T00017379001.1
MNAQKCFKDALSIFPAWHEKVSERRRHANRGTAKDFGTFFLPFTVRNFERLHKAQRYSLLEDHAHASTAGGSGKEAVKALKDHVEDDDAPQLHQGGKKSTAGASGHESSVLAVKKPTKNSMKTARKPRKGKIVILPDDVVEDTSKTRRRKNPLWDVALFKQLERYFERKKHLQQKSNSTSTSLSSKAEVDETTMNTENVDEKDFGQLLEECNGTRGKIEDKKSTKDASSSTSSSASSMKTTRKEQASAKAKQKAAGHVEHVHPELSTTFQWPSMEHPVPDIRRQSYDERALDRNYGSLLENVARRQRQILASFEEDRLRGASYGLKPTYSMIDLKERIAGLRSEVIAKIEEAEMKDEQEAPSTRTISSGVDSSTTKSAPVVDDLLDSTSSGSSCRPPATTQQDSSCSCETMLAFLDSLVDPTSGDLTMISDDMLPRKPVTFPEKARVREMRGPPASSCTTRSSHAGGSSSIREREGDRKNGAPLHQTAQTSQARRLQHQSPRSRHQQYLLAEARNRGFLPPHLEAKMVTDIVHCADKRRPSRFLEDLDSFLEKQTLTPTS